MHIKVAIVNSDEIGKFLKIMESASLDLDVLKENLKKNLTEIEEVDPRDRVLIELLGEHRRLIENTIYLVDLASTLVKLREDDVSGLKD